MAVEGTTPSNEDDRDRAAVEAIRGTLLPREWPADALPPGTRVQVVQDEVWTGPWTHVFTGRISDMGAPEPPASPAAKLGELAYWVDFDDPQLDADGCGPYRKAQIWDRYLQPTQ